MQSTDHPRGLLPYPSLPWQILEQCQGLKIIPFMSICVTKSLKICTSDPYKISLFLHQMHLTAWRRRWVRSPLSSTVAPTSHIRPSALAWRSAQLLWADSRGVKRSTWGPCSLAPVLRHSSIQTKVLYRQKFNCISPQNDVSICVRPTSHICHKNGSGGTEKIVFESALLNQVHNAQEMFESHGPSHQIAVMDQAKPKLVILESNDCLLNEYFVLRNPVPIPLISSMGESRHHLYFHNYWRWLDSDSSSAVATRNKCHRRDNENS